MQKKALYAMKGYTFPDEIEFNVIILKRDYLNYCICIGKIETLIEQSKRVPPKLLIEAVSYLIDKKIYQNRKVKWSINKDTNKVVDFFKVQNGYNFEGKHFTKGNNSFQDSSAYSLKDFVSKALLSYYSHPPKEEKKPTNKRDNVIRFFYELLLIYIKNLPSDPLISKEGKHQYKKKVIATYLTHVVCMPVLPDDKLTCPKLFHISLNAFKKTSPKV